MFFNNEGPVPETLRRLRKLLDDAGLPHIFMGATAVYLHGYERTTRDIDVCMRAADLERFRECYVGMEYQPVEGRRRQFLDPMTQITVDILLSGTIADSTRKLPEIKFPDPSEAEIVLQVPVPTLTRLVEIKLVRGRYRDWADVVELIRVNQLGQSYAEKIDPVVRSAYLQCYDQKLEEDRYNPEIDDPPRETQSE